MSKKYDQGKLRYSLVPFRALEEVIRVLEFGANKYSEDGWKTVPDAKRRYLDAAFRHLASYAAGEKVDPESGLSHLAHAGANVLFLIWFE